MISLTVNGQKHALDVEPETPLLWVLRDELGLTGTKFGCGIAQCGACSVHLNGALTRSCVVRVGDVDGASVLTIEGLSQDASHALSHDASHALSHDASHAVQRAWIELDVPQCGYCQSGQIMAAVALLQRTPQPSDRDIDDAITNICRCGSYPRIRAAVHRAAVLAKG